MVVADWYLKDVLGQLVGAYESVRSMGATPSDLEAMRREWLRARGLLTVLAGRLESSGTASDSHVILLEKTARYIENHDFDHELQMLLSVYPDDPDRVRNMQHKILESFEDSRFLEKIKQIIADL